MQKYADEKVKLQHANFMHTEQCCELDFGNTASRDIFFKKKIVLR